MSTDKKQDKPITLHPEHGVNPATLICPLCGSTVGIGLLGFNGGKEASKQIIADHACGKCVDLLMTKVIIILRDMYTKKRTGKYYSVSIEDAKKYLTLDTSQYRIVNIPQEDLEKISVLVEGKLKVEENIVEKSISTFPEEF